MQDTIPYEPLKKARFHALEAARWVAGAINAAEEGADVSAWCKFHQVLSDMADVLDPPKPCFPANVVPFPYEKVREG